MKKILLIACLAPLISYSQKDECSKYFKKDKKAKKESMFSEDKLIQTDFINFFNQHKRDIKIQFKKTNNSYIVFRQLTIDNVIGNRPVNFSVSIKVGLKFDNGEKFIVTFPSSESENINHSGMHSSSNETLIDEKLHKLLKENKIIAIEILNPCNDGNQSKTISEEISSGDSERILKVYNCFITK